MTFKKLRIFKTLAAFAGLYALEIAELSLLAIVAVTAPRWLIPVAILTQLGQLIAGVVVMVSIWKDPAKRGLGLLQNRIARLGQRGRSHRRAKGGEPSCL